MKNISKKRLTRIKERIRLYLTKGGKKMSNEQMARERLAGIARIEKAVELGQDGLVEGNERR